MARILILGCAGAGKTTLARQLGECMHAPVICLDALWESHGGGNNVATFKALVKEAHAKDHWISDGNFAQATFDIRLPRATLVIWLECSRLSCASRAIMRVFKRKGDQKIGALINVLTFIWNFNRINRPRIENLRVTHGPGVPILKLRSSREIAAFLSSCGYDLK